MTTSSDIVTAINAAWDSGTYPLAGTYTAGFTDDPRVSAWNLVEEIGEDMMDADSLPRKTFRIWMDNNVEGAIDALVDIINALDTSIGVLFVFPLGQYRNGDAYQGIVDVVISD